VSIRVAAVHVMIAVVLACPFLCAAQAESAETEGSESVWCGSHAPSDEDGKQCPEGPESGHCSCRACLCRGAVVDRHVETPRLTRLFAAYTAVNVASAEIIFRTGLPVPHTACHFPAAESGREVRALIESFLL
jgi:hypothetical protein